MPEQHTPGPWKATRGIDDDETRWIVVADNGGREWHIATIENRQPGDSLETEAATARLIAQAPALLSIAEAVEETVIEGECCPVCSQNPHVRGCLVANTLRAARGL